MPVCGVVHVCSFPEPGAEAAGATDTASSSGVDLSNSTLEAIAAKISELNVIKVGTRHCPGELQTMPQLV